MSTATKKTPSRTSPLSGASPAAQWFSHLPMSGKLLLFGGVAGVIAGFFPLVSLSSGMGLHAGPMIIDDWRGLLGVVGYLAAVVLAVMLYPAGRTPHRNLSWAALGLGGVLLLVGVWLLLATLRAGTGLPFFGDAGSVRIGLGVILNLFAAVTVAVGTLWKAREEQLV